MATSFNIQATQGFRLSAQLTATDSAGSLINLSGYSVSGVVRNRYSSSGFLIDLRPTIDPSYVSGLINILLPSTGVAALPVGSFVYDVGIFQTNTGIIDILQGKFLVSPGVSFI